MKLHRFIGEYNLNNDFVKITNLENIKQIKGVLRLEGGDKLILCDGEGTQVLAEIQQIEKREINLKILNKIPSTYPNKKVSLYLAILKKENFELAVQKAIECGVSEIIPIITERTVKTGLNTERIQKIIREACEQSGRSFIPKLKDTLNIKEALWDGAKNEEKVFFTLSEEIQNQIFKFKKDTINASIFIGPEGGFTEEEKDLALENNYTISSLGPLTLRGETAAIVATYLAVNY